jgi:hypothetical protein
VHCVGIYFCFCREEPAVTGIQAAVVTRLRERFGDSCLFFWNAAQGDLLGLVWKPKPHSQTQSFSILDSRHALPVAAMNTSLVTASDRTNGVCVFNVAKVVSDMVESSEGTIADIIIA